MFKMDSLFKIKNDTTDKSGSMMKQAENFWAMLDEMADSNPDSYKKFIDKTLKEGRENMKPPEAHMCVKSSISKPKKMDLYINFFGWKKVPAPESDDQPIPVYGVPIEYEADVAIANLAFNPQVLSDYGKHSKKPEETSLLINLAFNYIEDQNTDSLINKSEYQVLKNIDFKGDVSKWIKKLTSDKQTGKDPGQMSDLELAREAIGSNLPDSIINKVMNIELGESKATNQPKSTNEASKKPLIIEIPSYEEKLVPGKTDTDQAYLEVRINLPRINSITECELNVDSSVLILNAIKELYSELKIDLGRYENDHIVDIDNLEAKFVKKTSTLRIKIPLQSK